MKLYEKFITICTDKKEEVVNITDEVEKIINNSGIKDGFAMIFPFHTSSAVYISDSDFNLTSDFTMILSQMVRADIPYKHDEVDYKKNAAGHLKAILTGHHIFVPVKNASLHLGTYQTIYYIEFCGMRNKEVLVKVMGV